MFGSGGRAATAIAGLKPGTQLLGYVAEDWADDAQSSFGSMAVTPMLTRIPDRIGFRYFHPLSRAQAEGYSGHRFAALEAAGSAVLRFGMLEGSAIVHGERVVYDPQNWAEALAFRANGSTAEALAIVLNQLEIEDSTGKSGPDAVRKIIQETGAAVVVVKRGPRGATVYSGSTETQIPAFQSQAVFKIGSGDVFSGVFAHFWADGRLPPEEAARRASEAVATYVTSRDLQQLTSTTPLTPAPTADPKRVYLAGPFFYHGAAVACRGGA